MVEKLLVGQPVKTFHTYYTAQSSPSEAAESDPHPIFFKVYHPICTEVSHVVSCFQVF
jgi:hypothetical protein